MVMASPTVREILSNFLSTDAIARSSAQSLLDSADPIQLISRLVSDGLSIEHTSDDDLRGLAAVLIRSRLSNISRDSAAGIQAVRYEISEKILEAYVREPSENVRARLANAVAMAAEVACSNPADGEWTGLWTALNSLLSGESASRIQGLVLLKALASDASCLTLLNARTGPFVEYLGRSLDPQTATLQERLAACGVLAALQEGILADRHELSCISQALGKRGRKAIRPPRDFSSLTTSLRTLSESVAQVLANCCDALPERLGEAVGYAVQITEADPHFWDNSREGFLMGLGRLAAAEDQPFEIRQSSISTFVAIVRECLNCDIEEENIKHWSLLVELIRSILAKVIDFPDSEAEWRLRKEADSMGQTNPDNMLDCLHDTLASFVHATKSPHTFTRLLDFYTSLLPYKAPVDFLPPVLYFAFRGIIGLIESHPSDTSEVADDLLAFASKFVASASSTSSSSSPSDANAGVGNPRVRWAAITLLERLWARFPPLAEDELTLECLQVLSNVVVNDAELRCRNRALTAFFTFFSELEEECPSLDFFLDSLVSTVIVPSIRRPHSEGQGLAMAVASAVAAIAGKKFEPFYSDFIAVVKTIVCEGLEVLLAGKENSSISGDLVEASVTLGCRLCEAVGYDRSRNDASELAPRYVQLLEYLASKEEVDEILKLELPSICAGVTSIAILMKEDFQPLMPRLVACLTKVLQRSDQPEITRNAEGVEASALTVGLDVMAKAMKGAVNFSESDGVSSLIVPGKAEENVFKFRTGVIVDKASALDGISRSLGQAGALWVPYLPAVFPIIKAECSSIYSLVRKSAVDALENLLPGMLPCDAEFDVPWECSVCPLATGLISTSDFTKLAEETVAVVLSAFDERRTSKAAEFVVALETICTAISESQMFFKFDEAFRDQLMHNLFTAFGKTMITVMSEDIEGAEKENEQGAACNGVANHEHWEDESCGSDKDEEDHAGVVYCGIMRSVNSLFKLYGELCVPHFMTHLHTAYTGLLALPDVNMSGRVAALCAFAVCIEKGGVAGQAVAAEVLPIAILFSNANEGATEDTMADDVERVQAACYCVGVISKACPGVFEPVFDSALSTLKAVLRHPFAKSEERRPAVDCSCGALLKIYLNPRYQERITFPAAEMSLRSLLAEWFPLTDDEDESRGAIDALIEELENPQSQILMGRQMRATLLDVFQKLDELATGACILISKETRTSGRFERAMKTLAPAA